MLSEKQALVERLTVQREHILEAVVGLGAEDLRRPVLPSGWTCLELVNHLALDVERLWFSAVMGGREDLVRIETEGREDGWHLAPDATPDEVLGNYRRQIEQADAVIAATAIDAEPAWWPSTLGDSRLDTLRDVLLHVIVETATHAGHLDAACELLDGRTWLILD
jgi:uncharacterized damage-inducible protein DinB